ncbi:hypothetical protein [Gudongella sp. SC589]|uniref:hypothetical protein n=1 Tax=Gudongella sp. SC589 TaxID=3385990 RepID=UPI0039047D2D
MKAKRDLQNDIAQLSSSLKEKEKVVLELELFEKMIIRLNSLSGKCQECKSLLDEAKPHFKELMDNHGETDKAMRKRHDKLMERMLKHLRKVHGLYRVGHFMSIYLPLGIAIGVTLGLINSKILYYTVAGGAFGYLIGLLVENYIMKKRSRI